MSDDLEPDWVTEGPVEILNPSLEERLKAVLLRHFSNVSEETAKELAESLCFRFDWEQAKFEVAKANKSPAKDAELLRKATKAINSASNQVRRLGLFGTTELNNALQAIGTDIENCDKVTTVERSGREYSVDDDRDNAILQTFMWDRDGLADHLAKLADLIYRAHTAIEDGLGNNSLKPAFSGNEEYSCTSGWWDGGKELVHIRKFSIECAKIYGDYSGRNVTLGNDSNNGKNERAGPYLRYMTDTLSTLGISRGFERWAKQTADLPIFKNNKK